MHWIRLFDKKEKESNEKKRESRWLYKLMHRLRKLHKSKEEQDCSASEKVQNSKK